MWESESVCGDGGCGWVAGGDGVPDSLVPFHWFHHLPLPFLPRLRPSSGLFFFFLLYLYKTNRYPPGCGERRLLPLGHIETNCLNRKNRNRNVSSAVCGSEPKPSPFARHVHVFILLSCMLPPVRRPARCGGYTLRLLLLQPFIFHCVKLVWVCPAYDGQGVVYTGTGAFKSKWRRWMWMGDRWWHMSRISHTLNWHALPPCCYGNGVSPKTTDIFACLHIILFI